jgi:hypothetical protein
MEIMFDFHDFLEFLVCLSVCYPLCDLSWSAAGKRAHALAILAPATLAPLMYTGTGSKDFQIDAAVFDKVHASVVPLYQNARIRARGVNVCALVCLARRARRARRAHGSRSSHLGHFSVCHIPPICLCCVADGGAAATECKSENGGAFATICGTSCWSLAVSDARSCFFVCFESCLHSASLEIVCPCAIAYLFVLCSTV